MVLIEDILEVPRDCIVDIVIPKNDVYEAAKLTPKDKKIFTDIVKQIKWCYKFSEDNVRVQKYIDNTRKYYEVELFNVKLKYDNVHKIGTGKFKEDDKIDRIATILMRYIPYPLILTMQYENELKFYCAHIRDHKSDYNKTVFDEKFSTNWIDINNINKIEEDFITKIQLNNLDHRDFYKFYNTYFEAIIQHDAAMIAGGTVNLPVDEIKKIYNEISLLETKISNIEKKISQEPNYNVKSKLNIKVHSLKQEKVKLKNELKGE